MDPVLLRKTTTSTRSAKVVKQHAKVRLAKPSGSSKGYDCVFQAVWAENAVIFETVILKSCRKMMLSADAGSWKKTFPAYVSFCKIMAHSLIFLLIQRFSPEASNQLSEKNWRLRWKGVRKRIVSIKVPLWYLWYTLWLQELQADVTLTTPQPKRRCKYVNVLQKTQ